MSRLFGPIDQIGYVVQDLDRARTRWQQHLGLGPWTVYRNVALQGHYRGGPTEVTMDVALAYQGTVQIELIAVTNHAPSPYRDAQGQLRQGMHHIAWIVDDLAPAVAALEATGMQVVFDAGNAATHVAYLEDPAEPSVLYELICGAGMRQMQQQGIEAAQHWSGTHPVHEIDFAALQD